MTTDTFEQTLREIEIIKNSLEENYLEEHCVQQSETISAGDRNYTVNAGYSSFDIQSAKEYAKEQLTKALNQLYKSN